MRTWKETARQPPVDRRGGATASDVMTALLREGVPYQEPPTPDLTPIPRRPETVGASNVKVIRHCQCCPKAEEGV